MKRFVLVAAAAGLSLAASQAMAVDTIIVNNWIYQCQTACTVSSTSSGMIVGDLYGGWVQFMGRGRSVPAPLSVDEPEPVEA